MKNGKCPAGQYYCYTNKECIPIPAGFMVDPEGMLRKENGASIDEAGSLHHWFKGSKSKGGKPGWVQADGSPCANEPGETKTPKCFSSARLAALKRKGKKGEAIIRSAVRRKRQEDPGQQQKSGAAKPTNVKTFAKGRKSKDYVKPEPGLKEMVEAKDHEHSMIRSELSTIQKAVDRLKSKMKGEGNVEAWVQSKITKAADYIDSAADYIDSGEHDIEEATKDIKGKSSGKKDACYHKVKSRYSVWPSAYASGALVKCRKVGASNWGTKSEETNIDEKIDVTKQSSKRKSLGRGSSIKHGAKKTGYESPAEFRNTEKKLAPYQKEENQIDEKCWPGYEKKGMKTMFGKKYPNCVKKEEVTCNLTKKGKKCPIHGIEECPLEEAIRLPSKTGNIILVTLTWRGKYYAIKMFFPQVSVPNRRDVQDQINKVYPGARVLAYNISEIKPGEQFLQTEDWQKVNRKDKTDGLSQKAVNAYRRENPGSKLQTAVTTPPSELKRGSADWKRRRNFCSRSRSWTGERGKAARRRWNCN